MHPRPAGQIIRVWCQPMNYEIYDITVSQECCVSRVTTPSVIATGQWSAPMGTGMSSNDAFWHGWGTEAHGDSSRRRAVSFKTCGLSSSMATPSVDHLVVRRDSGCRNAVSNSASCQGWRLSPPGSGGSVEAVSLGSEMNTSSISPWPSVSGTSPLIFPMYRRMPCVVLSPPWHKLGISSWWLGNHHQPEAIPQASWCFQSTEGHLAPQPCVWWAVITICSANQPSQLQTVCDVKQKQLKQK